LAYLDDEKVVFVDIGDVPKLSEIEGPVEGGS
jgi:hypothetical protein